MRVKIFKILQIIQNKIKRFLFLAISAAFPGLVGTINLYKVNTLPRRLVRLVLNGFVMFSHHGEVGPGNGGELKLTSWGKL